MDHPVVKASAEAAIDAVCDVIKVMKEKKSLLQEGVDLVQALVNDEDFKVKVAALIAAGFSGLIADAKSLNLMDGISLGVEEIPAAISKIQSAISA